MNLVYVRIFRESLSVCLCASFLGDLGPVVHSIVSLTSSLRGQPVKCLMTL